MTQTTTRKRTDKGRKSVEITNEAHANLAAVAADMAAQKGLERLSLAAAVGVLARDYLDRKGRAGSRGKPLRSPVASPELDAPVVSPDA